MDINNLLSISKDLNVLYIEDDISKDVTVKFLDEIFKEVDVAEDGVIGLDKYKSYYEKNNEYYDLVISDINMPNMNGIELSKNVLQLNEKQMLIIVSAYNDSKNLIELINLGVSSFIQKPIRFENTISVFSKVCQNIYNSKMVLEFNEKIKQLNEELKNSNCQLEKKVEERTSELRELLYFDKLTSLKSYHSLMKNIEKNESLALFVINIDSFLNINSMYGFEESNSLLIQFSQCLKYFNTNYSYEVYRVYSDEFVIAKEINNNNNIKEYENILFEIMDVIKSYNFTVDKGTPIEINASVGLSINQQNPFVCASMALRHAKKHRLPYFIYNDDLDNSKSVKNIINWAPRLKKAIKENLILTAFQPIVDKDANILKFEVLMRVAEKTKDSVNIISPYLFLEPAIKTRLYNDMMSILIEKSFITMYNRKEDFSINLSYEDIYNQTLIDIIKNNLKRFKKIGSRLIIEILETESIEDLEIMQRFIKEVRKFGVRIAIDDFGTGHSNFSNIISINPDYIKIDGSFIKNIHENSTSYTLVKGIISSSKELNIKTIAEYVHCKEVFDVLVDLGVDEFQGYYFSEPLLNI